MEMEKLNSTAYHPQTDGLAERFNRTLTDMLAKRVERSGKDWDAHLPLCFLFIMLVYKSQQKNCPFIYYMDIIPSYQLPLDWTVGSSSSSSSSSRSTSLIWIYTYKAEVEFKFSEAWKSARDNIY